MYILQSKTIKYYIIHRTTNYVNKRTSKYNNTNAYESSKKN